MCEENHLCYKCENWKAMTGKEKMNFVKTQDLSFNCFKVDHRAEKWLSQNSCLFPECADIRHASLYDYLKKKVKETIAHGRSESTLIRSGFAKRLNLWKNSKIVNISSIKEFGELLNADEVKLYVIDEENTSRFHINKPLAIKKRNSIYRHNFFHYISNKIENWHICKDWSWATSTQVVPW